MLVLMPKAVDQDVAVQHPVAGLSAGKATSLFHAGRRGWNPGVTGCLNWLTIVWPGAPAQAGVASANMCWWLALSGGDLLGWACSVVAVSSVGSLLVAGLGLQHGLQVNQVVVEDGASDVQQLEDLRVAYRVVHAGPGAPCVHDVLGAQDGQLL